MKKTPPWLFALIIIILSGMAGCGLKGPLYIPPAPDKFTAVPAPSGIEISTKQTIIHSSGV